jgi:hypothetical protein
MHQVRRRGVIATAVALAAAGLALGTLPPSVEARSAWRADRALEAAAHFVAQFQRELSFVVADEIYVQQLSVAGRQPVTRTLRGEIFLTYLIPERAWITVHDFLEVDGTAVIDREAVRDLLVHRPVGRIAPALAAQNARYNLGNVRRNFNEPTLPLQLFEPWRLDRLRVSRVRTTVRDGRTIVTLRLREQERPTLVSSTRGGPVFADTEVDVDLETGVISRTLMKLRDRTLEVAQETTYELSSALGIMVPTIFTERYVQTAVGQAEVITCHSAYTNYRRFEVSGRLLVGGD